MFPLTRCRNCGSGLRIRPITFWATPGCQSQLPCQGKGEPAMARKGRANQKIDLQQCSVLVSSETAAAGAYAPNFSSPRMRHDQRFMRTLLERCGKAASTQASLLEPDSEQALAWALSAMPAACTRTESWWERYLCPPYSGGSEGQDEP